MIPAGVNVPGTGNTHGVWTCGHCGKAAAAHANGMPASGCLYEPVWRPASGALPGNPTREQIAQAIFGTAIGRSLTVGQIDALTDAVLALRPVPAPDDTEKCPACSGGGLAALCSGSVHRAPAPDDAADLRATLVETVARENASSRRHVQHIVERDEGRAELDALRAAVTALRAQVQPLTTVAAAWLDLRLTDALDGKA